MSKNIIRDTIKLTFDSMFDKWAEEKSAGRSGGIHASDLIKPDNKEDRYDNRFCYRECVLKCFYKPNKVNNSTHLNKIFLNGWHLHIKWQELFEKYLKVKAIEKTFFHDEFIPISFTPDAIINIMNRDVIVEIKGYKAEDVDKMDENGPAPESAEIQAQLYCYLTGIGQAVILVENKNTQFFKVWYVKHDFKKIEHIVKRLENLKLYMAKWQTNNKYLPSKICRGINDERAKKCSMSDACFDNHEGRKELKLENELVS